MTHPFETIEEQDIRFGDLVPGMLIIAGNGHVIYVVSVGKQTFSYFARRGPQFGVTYRQISIRKYTETDVVFSIATIAKIPSATAHSS